MVRSRWRLAMALPNPVPGAADDPLLSALLARLQPPADAGPKLKSEEESRLAVHDKLLDAR
jgi:hypothetical protein